MKTERKEHYEKFMNSKAWQKVKQNMPAPKECVSCQSTENLHLHHMFYPNDVFQTKTYHCCWLCVSCHNLFHKKVKGALPLPEIVWKILLSETKSTIAAERAKAEKPAKRKRAKKAKESVYYGRALVAPITTGWRVVPPSLVLAEAIARDNLRESRRPCAQEAKAK